MKLDSAEGVNARIAARVRQLRAARGLSLETLAANSGVSRSMISLIERAQTSATAAVLERLASGLDVSLPALFDAVPASAPASPVARRAQQPVWQDPDSGYVRRNLSPLAFAEAPRIVEVEFPAGARVAFENAARTSRVLQQIWVLKGSIEVTVGRDRQRLREGDCMAMYLDEPTVFHNPTRRTTRYALVVSADKAVRR